MLAAERYKPHIKTISIELFLTLITSLLAWGLSIILLLSVEKVFIIFKYIFQVTETKNISLPIFTILISLLLSSLLTAIFLTKNKWRDARGDGLARAIKNLNITRDGIYDHPAPRYKRTTIIGAFQKILVSITTLGLGGAGGLESNVALIGEQSGAFLSKIFKFKNEAILRLTQLVGISSALSTLTGYPIFSAIFAMEICYKNRLLHRSLAFSFLAAILAHFFSSTLNVKASFSFLSGLKITSFPTNDWIPMIVVFILSGIIFGLSYLKFFKFAQNIFKKNNSYTSRMIIGGLITAVCGIIFYIVVRDFPFQIIGSGEGTLEWMITHQSLVWVILLAIILRILTVTATVASGSSAGLLIPLFMLGSSIGIWVHSLFNLSNSNLAIFIVIGASSILTVALDVPMAAIILVTEIMGSGAIIPAAIVSAIAYIPFSKYTLYERKN